MHPRRERPNMSRIIAIHSFRGGTGKSNTTANIAALLAAEGRRIGVVDADIQSPGIHVLFGMSQDAMRRSLNDYLWGRCPIGDAAYDVSLLNTGVRHLIKEFGLDTLIIDTHPGLNEETLLSIAICDALAIVMRPDQQDYEGTSVAVSVARKLRVPRMVLVVNNTPTVFDVAEVKERVERAYGCEVAAVLP